MARSIGLALAALTAGLVIGTYLGRRSHAQPEEIAGPGVEPVSSLAEEEQAPASSPDIAERTLVTAEAAPV